MNLVGDFKRLEKERKFGAKKGGRYETPPMICQKSKLLKLQNDAKSKKSHPVSYIEAALQSTSTSTGTSRR